MYTPLTSPDGSPTLSDDDEEEAPEPPRKKQRSVQIKPPADQESLEVLGGSVCYKILDMKKIIFPEELIRNETKAFIQVHLEAFSAEIEVLGAKLYRIAVEIQNMIKSFHAEIIHQQNTLFEQVYEMLLEVYRRVCRLNAQHNVARKTPDHARTFPAKNQKIRQVNKSKVQCILCSKKNHKSADCRTIPSMAYRKLVLQRKGICFKCLKPGFDAVLGYHPGCPEPNMQCENCHEYRDDGQGDHHENICDTLELQALLDQI